MKYTRVGLTGSQVEGAINTMGEIKSAICPEKRTARGEEAGGVAPAMAATGEARGVMERIEERFWGK